MPAILTDYLVAAGFSLIGVLCVLVVIVGLPGAWLLIASAVVIDCLDWLWLPASAPLTFHPITLGVAVIVAGIGEVLEFALSAAGAKRFGASRAGMIGSIVGGMIGVLAGTVFIPIPILGTLLGALAGTAAGAAIGELHHGTKPISELAKPVSGAVLGRILGTLAKVPAAFIVFLVLAVAAWRA